MLTQSYDDDYNVDDDNCDCYHIWFVQNVGTGNQNLLNQVTLPILSDEQWCTTPYTLCAGPMVAYKYICSGDSGGPFVCKQGDKWYQYGVNSFIYSCTEAGYPSGFADVVYFYQWIQQKIGGQCLCC